MEGGTGRPVSCPRLAELPRARGEGFPWDEETSPSADRALPPITIVTPSLNQARFLEGAIRSVLLQGYPAVEYIVLDAGSSDGSVDIIRAYARWITRWRSAPDRGQAAAINEGATAGEGELVGWLNSDDRFLEGALQAFAHARAEDPAAVAYCGTGLYADERGRFLGRHEPLGLTRDELASWQANHIHQPACLVTRRAFERAGGVDESMRCAFDVDLWLKLAGQGRIAKVESELALALVHEDAKTQVLVDVMLAEHAVALMRHGYEAETVRAVCRRMQPYIELAAKVRRISSNPLYRAIRPVLRAFGLVAKRPRHPELRCVLAPRPGGGAGGGRG